MELQTKLYKIHGTQNQRYEIHETQNQTLLNTWKSKPNVIE